MDRYWIARQAISNNKLVIPESDEINKYSEPLKISQDSIVLNKKAELCIRIIRKRFPGITSENIPKCVDGLNLMRYTVEELSAMLPDMWKLTKI